MSSKRYRFLKVVPCIIAPCIAIRITVVCILLGVAQMSWAQNTPKSKTSRHPHKYGAGLYVGPQFIFSSNGILLYASLTDRVSLDLSIPFSGYYYGFLESMVSPDSPDSPDSPEPDNTNQLYTLNSSQNIWTVSSRASLFPWPEHGFYIGTGLSLTHHHIKFNESLHRKTIQAGQYAALGGGFTTGVGYRVTPTNRLFVNIYYVLFAYHKVFTQLSGDPITSDLKNNLHNHYTLNRLLIQVRSRRALISNIFRFSVGVGIAF